MEYPVSAPSEVLPLGQRDFLCLEAASFPDESSLWLRSSDVEKSSSELYFVRVLPIMGEDEGQSVSEHLPESLSLGQGMCAKQAVGQSWGALSIAARSHEHAQGQ